MKRLLLIRHGKSSWKDPAISDLMRPLKKRGLRDAVEMAERLTELDVRVERVLLSPARRVMETFEQMREETGFGQNLEEVIPELYSYNYEDLMHLLKTVDDKLDTIALIGHNPAITDLVNFLCLEELSNIPTCGLAVLDLDIDAWSGLRAGSAALTHYDYPKKEADLEV